MIKKNQDISYSERKKLLLHYDLRSPSVQSNKFIPTGNSTKTHVILNCMVKKINKKTNVQQILK